MIIIRLHVIISIHCILISAESVRAVLANKIAGEIKPTNAHHHHAFAASGWMMMERGLEIVSDQIDDINKVPGERSAINCRLLSQSLSMCVARQCLCTTKLLSAADAKDTNT